MAKRVLADGSALEKLRLFIDGQGEDVKVIDDYSVFPQAKHHLELFAKKPDISAKSKQDRLVSLRNIPVPEEKKEDMVDLSAGILLAKNLEMQWKKDLCSRRYSETMLRK